MPQRVSTRVSVHMNPAWYHAGPAPKLDVAVNDWTKDLRPNDEYHTLRLKAAGEDGDNAVLTIFLSPDQLRSFFHQVIGLASERKEPSFLEAVQHQGGFLYGEQMDVLQKKYDAIKDEYRELHDGAHGLYDALMVLRNDFVLSTAIQENDPKAWEQMGNALTNVEQFELEGEVVFMDDPDLSEQDLEDIGTFGFLPEGEPTGAGAESAEVSGEENPVTGRIEYPDHDDEATRKFERLGESLEARPVCTTCNDQGVVGPYAPGGEPEPCPDGCEAGQQEIKDRERREFNQENGHGFHTARGDWPDQSFETVYDQS